MKLNLFLIGIGGAIGSILRYCTALWFVRIYASNFIPYSTMFINFAGSLLIGIVFGLAERYQWMTPQWRLFLVTGICGGYTTFSAFAYENVSLLQQANYTGFALYTSLSFVLGLIAVVLGLSLVKIF